MFTSLLSFGKALLSKSAPRPRTKVYRPEPLLAEIEPAKPQAKSKIYITDSHVLEVIPVEQECFWIRPTPKIRLTERGIKTDLRPVLEARAKRKSTEIEEVLYSRYCDWKTGRSRFRKICKHLGLSGYSKCQGFTAYVRFLKENNVSKADLIKAMDEIESV